MIYKGSNRYKTYNGIGLKYIKNPRFPVFVEYIEGDGNQYITLADITSFTTKFEMSAHLSISSYNESNQPTFMCFFGVQCYLRSASNTFYCWTSTGGSLSSNVEYTLNKKCNVTYSINSSSLRTLKIDFASQRSSTGSYNANPVNLFSLLNSSNASMYAPAMKLYGCQIKNNNVLIRDLRPCLSSEIGHSNEACLYDTVTNKYYYNIGSGTFNAGNKL